MRQPVLFKAENGLVYLGPRREPCRYIAICLHARLHWAEIGNVCGRVREVCTASALNRALVNLIPFNSSSSSSILVAMSPRSTNTMLPGDGPAFGDEQVPCLRILLLQCYCPFMQFFIQSPRFICASFVSSLSRGTVARLWWLWLAPNTTQYQHGDAPGCQKPLPTVWKACLPAKRAFQARGPASRELALWSLINEPLVRHIMQPWGDRLRSRRVSDRAR